MLLACLEELCHGVVTQRNGANVKGTNENRPSTMKYWACVIQAGSLLTPKTQRRELPLKTTLVRDSDQSIAVLVENRFKLDACLRLG